MSLRILITLLLLSINSISQTLSYFPDYPEIAINTDKCNIIFSIREDTESGLDTVYITPVNNDEAMFYIDGSIFQSIPKAGFLINDPTNEIDSIVITAWKNDSVNVNFDTVFNFQDHFGFTVCNFTLTTYREGTIIETITRQLSSLCIVDIHDNYTNKEFYSKSQSYRTSPMIFNIKGQLVKELKNEIGKQLSKGFLLIKSNKGAIQKVIQ